MKHRVIMLGAGLIATSYCRAIRQSRLNCDVIGVYSRSAERSAAFANKWGIPETFTDLASACVDSTADTAIVALPNNLHVIAVEACAQVGKNVLCTKPLGRSITEAQSILNIASTSSGVFGYLEDLAYCPSTRNIIDAVASGDFGTVEWVRSRQAHGGPHSEWFRTAEISGGGALLDLGPHAVEIIRSFVGKDDRVVGVCCAMSGDPRMETSAYGLMRFESGAVGQVEASWGTRGGMELVDEVNGSRGTAQLNHSLRGGCTAFIEGRSLVLGDEKADGSSGWLYPIANPEYKFGRVSMFQDMFDSIDRGTEPIETFHDGYVVNCVIESFYRSAKSGHWEVVDSEL